MDIPPRIAAYIARVYGTNAPAVGDLLRSLPRQGTSPEGAERICAAVLILGQGDVSRLVEAASLAERDWRDVLVFAELASPDWRDRVESWLADEGQA